MKKKLLSLFITVLVITQPRLNAQTEVLDLKFDGDATDSSSFSNHGTVTGAQPVFDRNGNASAFYFDGVDDVITIPHHSSYKVAYPLTISIWVWLEDSSANNQFFTNNNHSALYYGVVLATTGNTGKVALSFGDGTGAGSGDRRTVIGSTPLTNRKWHHIVGVINGSVNMDLYIDGVQETVTYSGTGGPTIAYTTSNAATIGHVDRSPSPTGIFFNGALDDLTIWDGALNNTQIQNLYTPGANDNLWMTNTGLQFSYGFDNGGMDATPNQNDGTISGAQLVKDRFNSSSAYYFDGIDDIMTVPHDGSFKTQYPLTIALWVWLDDSSAVNKILTNNNHTTQYYGIMVATNSGKLAVNYGSGGGAGPANRRSAVGTTLLRSKKWHQVVGVINGPTNMDLYIDGVQETVTYSGTGGVNIAYNNSNNATIGSVDRSPNAQDYFKGALDGINYWDRALTSLEVQALYNPGTHDGLGVSVDATPVIACDSAQVDGNWYFSSQTVTTTFTNGSVNGYDSTVTTPLTVNSSVIVNASPVISCDSAQINGNWYFSSQTVTDIFPGGTSTNCDSTVITALTINSVNNGVTDNSPTLTANETGATYQWIDCNNMQPIGGANNQSYTATNNGSYAVVVTKNGCVDTSSCIAVTTIGIEESLFDSQITLYPNPMRETVTLNLGVNKNITIQIYDVAGKEVYSLSNINDSKVELSPNLKNGVYFVKVQNGQAEQVIKLIKQ